ncbi:MAG: signal recognition particle-docking protein FtsY [Lachnospiraceae bacterium]|nr:signal recognition particle-docking protein FtsY [Lachnospiraceae bacterium]
MSFFKKLASIFKEHEKINEEFYDELEETLVMGDVGIELSQEILGELKSAVKKKWIVDAAEAREVLKENMINRLEADRDGSEYDYENKQSVILAVGVNGVGKTTTVGKLAWLYKNRGKDVLLAAADTFRAAAIDQLSVWAERTGADIIKGTEGGDPGAVIFDAVKAARARNREILICDTAGRLHNKKNLINELKKLYTILDREYPEAVKETFIVVDGTTGQNALNQAREFKEAANATGLVVTKLDGSAKGGIALAIQSELKIPIKFIGVGEKAEDLRKFDPAEFVNGIFRSQEQ